MRNLDNLMQYVRDMVEEYPQLKDEIFELYGLCLDEIEAGGSISHEVSTCYSDIEDLITSKQ